MCSRSYMKKGISAVAGGLIILAILFTTIIPLIILMQNSYAIFLNESNSRRIFDTDRISESLAVKVSQDTETKQLVLILSNNGPVYVRVVRVWAIDVAMQRSIRDDGPCLVEEPPGLSPGANSTLNVQHCIDEFTGIVQFIVVSEKGRLFSSNKIYLRKGELIDIVFPYTLTVSIINMKKGRMYEIYVTPIGNGKVSPEKFTHKATASNENVTVAFGVFPGNYSVTLYENGDLVYISEGNPQIIEVPDTSAVIFMLEHGSIIPIPLDVIIISPRKVKEKSFFNVLIDVMLPEQANETVSIINVGNINIRSDLPSGQFDFECESYPGARLSPGDRETVIDCFISVGEKGGGGPKTITITVPQGTIVGVGESGRQYVNRQASKEIKVI